MDSVQLLIVNSIMIHNNRDNKAHRISLNLTTKEEMIILGLIIIKISHNSFQDHLNRIEITNITITTKTISIKIILKENPKIIQISIIIIIFRESLMKDKILIDKIIDMMTDRMIGIDSLKIIINRGITNMKEN